MSIPDAEVTARYAVGLVALLPEGPAWAGFREPGGRGHAILEAKAGGLAVIEARSRELVRDLNPLYAVETLAAREREAGLPDPCLPSDLTIEERRLHLIARWRQQGSQHLSYFTSLAADLKYPATITERRPFRCGYSQCGGDHQCGTPKMRHHWYVTVHEPRINYFRCGQSQVGRDPLGFVRRAEDLECVMRRVQPSHTVLHFKYEGL